MPTPLEKAEAREHAVQYLRRVIDRQTLIHTHVDYGRGERDYVHVLVVRPEPDGRHAILDVSYYVARAAGRPYSDRGIAYGGGQYSKALEAADDCWRAVFGEPIPQTDSWRELRF